MLKKFVEIMASKGSGRMEDVSVYFINLFRFPRCILADAMSRFGLWKISVCDVLMF